MLCSHTVAHFALITAIIVTGSTGSPISSGREVEILRSDGTAWCSLPDLPGGGWAHHTQSGLVTCGGNGAYHSKSCVTFDTSDGSWRTSHHLLHDRCYHSSWFSEQHGIILMGGGDYYSPDNTSLTTTERLNDNGGSDETFHLKYRIQ